MSLGRQQTTKLILQLIHHLVVSAASARRNVCDVRLVLQHVIKWHSLPCHQFDIQVVHRHSLRQLLLTRQDVVLHDAAACRTQDSGLPDSRPISSSYHCNRRDSLTLTWLCYCTASSITFNYLSYRFITRCGLKCLYSV